MRRRKKTSTRVLPVKKLVATQHKAKRKMGTKKEEKDEQEFFAEKVKEQSQDQEKGQQTMADKNEPKSAKIERPEGASKDAVISDVGVTEPTIEFGGDGVTPKAEWAEKYADIKKKQDEFDEKRRQRAREDSGVMITTEKLKNG